MAFDKMKINHETKKKIKFNFNFYWSNNVDSVCVYQCRYRSLKLWILNIEKKTQNLFKNNSNNYLLLTAFKLM